MPFEAISRADLPQTVTIYNVFKDPDTGAVAYYRTILEAVRVGQAKTSLREAVRGVTKLSRVSILMDRRTTQGYVLNEAGRRVKKPYLPWQVWAGRPAEEKAQAWTLNVNDLMAAVVGQKVTIVPEFEPEREHEFKIQHGLSLIIDIHPTVDEDGSVHSWSVGLD